MNILLMGHRGYLGSFLKDNLEVDITPQRNDYEYIINCIGKPNLEFCEENPDVSYVSNCKVVIDAVNRYPQSKIIHFSSYYVYDNNGESTESSPTTAKYKYCEHKILSEQLITKSGGVSFRIGKLFGHIDIGKQNKLTEYLLKSHTVTLDDVRFNPTSLNQVLRVIKHELETGELRGVFNLANDGNCSHYEYGRFIRQNFNPQMKINRICKHGRVFHNYGRFLMSCDKIKKIVPLAPWEDDMVEYLGGLNV